MRYKNDLQRTAIPILGLLTWQPMAGYELKREIAGSLQNFWSESFGQLYPQLNKLDAAGLIEAVPETVSDGRGKRVYRITGQGRQVLKEWLALPPHPRPPRDELLMKVFFAGEGDAAEIASHVRASCRNAEETLNKYREIEIRIIGMSKTIPKARYWLMTVRNGIAHVQAHIQWCHETLNEFEK